MYDSFDRRTDMCFRLLRVSYGMVGVIEAINGFLVYFVIMADHGFLPTTLFLLREQWDSKGVNDLQDSFGQEWVSNHEYLPVLIAV